MFANRGASVPAIPSISAGKAPTCLTMLLLGLGSTTADAHTYQLIDVDVPCAISTSAVSIDNAGIITGSWLDENGAEHGFIRATNGAFTAFDVPGATATIPVSLNGNATVVGVYEDANGNYSGFTRSSNQTITTFEINGYPNSGTYPTAINSKLGITGSYQTGNTSHGFVISPGGTVATFDPAGSKLTNPAGIDNGGEIAGDYADDSFVYHGFFRSRNGRMKAFDPAGSADTFVFSINREGAIVGRYADAGGVNHAYIRSPNGSFVVFEAPDAGKHDGQGTVAASINRSGETAGSFVDAKGRQHGFLRDADGTVRSIDPAGSASTAPVAINDGGAVTGSWLDGNGVSHGFLLNR